MSPSVSILICTRNRADHLQATLNSLRNTHIPPLSALELIVVDNGSTDHTRKVVEAADLSFPVRYVREQRPGAANARNRALSAAQYDILLWTDDDIRVPVHWIGPMIAPIAENRADVVAGGVQLAPHLKRDWMAGWHYTLLASTSYYPWEETLHDAVGANMAFGAHVLEKVPEFDPELGPGRLGLCEESHFVERAAHHGYRVHPEPDVKVEHHFDPDRLTTPSLENALQGLGRSQAYLRYHWRHDDPVTHESALQTWLRIVMLRAKGALKGLLHRSRADGEALPTWRSYYVRQEAYLRQSLIERRRPQKYDRLAARPRPSTAHQQPDGLLQWVRSQLRVLKRTT